MPSSSFSLLICVIVLSAVSAVDGSAHCTLCGFVANTVEGLLRENRTAVEIQSLIDKDICKVIPANWTAVCDKIAGEVPLIVDQLIDHHKPGAVCQSLGYCDQPAKHRADPTNLRKTVVNLDLPPMQRWNEALLPYRETFQQIKALLYSIFPGHLARIEPLGEWAVKHMPQPYSDEIKGAAETLNVTVGLLGLANLGYELSDLCTSIVAQDTNGAIHHARNLDFGVGMDFTDLLRNMTFHVDFTSQNKTVYQGITYASFVGLLTGMRPDGFAVTINTRFYPGPIWDIFSEVVAAIVLKGAAVNSQVIRDVLLNTTNFKDALVQFQTRPLLADVYFTVSGVAPGEGCVVTRNQTEAVDTWCLDAASGRWFVLETNYDHWKPAPWFDNRREPAIDALDNLGQANLTESNLLGVLSTKPVFNQMTTYSIVASAKDGVLDGWSRYCNEPCPE